MAASESTGGQMLGSHRLAWPENSEQVLGLTLVLIDRLAADSRYAIDIGHQYFYSGSKVIAGIHSLTRQVIIPFVRDYRTYVVSYGNVEAKLIASTSNKVFIVHGHDGTPKAEVARFIEKLGLEAVILHERPNKGRTLITKFQEEAGTAGFCGSFDDTRRPRQGSSSSRSQSTSSPKRRIRAWVFHRQVGTGPRCGFSKRRCGEAV